MKKQFQVIVALFLLLFMASCCTESPIPETPPTTIVTVPQTHAKSYSYLALGDSYTIGQSVCETCRFPAQVSKSLGNWNVTNTYS
ncbi:hypothetical protein [Flavobacterium sp. LB2P74]|uniref:hypothetical protein n=1 Tax=Flavobacterium sp. LB2P74 TaxID=3401717 RepID=UPI003AAD9090